MDFKQYEYVLMVAEEKSFSKAAKKLYISQPSLSQYISRIESNLGVSLFNRSSNPLSLTFEGQIYVETAHKIMSMTGEMLKAFDDVKELKKGKLNIGVTPSKSNHPMPSILPFYKSRYPDIEISLTEETSKELEELIVNGHVDIAIMNLPISNDSIDYEPLMTEKILLCAPPDQKVLPYEEFETVDIRMLEKEQFILHKTGLRIRLLANNIFHEAGFKPSVLLETRNIETSIRLAAAGLGFTFAPESAALYSGLQKTPKYYVIGDPPLTWEMTLAYKKDAYVTKAARAFADIAKDVVSKMYSQEMTKNL
ncbi:LysR family transcriptional regulator [Tyzzerella sp. OttesenSCG-928-J15]|nr:LysR family transcriptional regulator [Tyzzerella sp. OttesenSCG-928-J15]